MCEEATKCQKRRTVEMVPGRMKLSRHKSRDALTPKGVEGARKWGIPTN